MLDALATKTIDTTTTAGTYFPVGANASGGSSVDEFAINTGPIGTPLEIGILVPSQAGTSPTLDATVEWSDSTAFSTIHHTATLGPQMTASNTYPLRRRVHMTSRDTYCRVKLVTAGTTPGFGIVTAWVSHPQSHHAGFGATND